MVRSLRTPEARRNFAPTVTLHASVLEGTCRGVEAVSAYFAAASSMYDSLRFTSETASGPRTFLEWEGRALGYDVAGITVLMRNRAGRISNIRLYHRPLAALRRLSEELGKRLSGVLDREPPSLARERVRKSASVRRQR